MHDGFIKPCNNYWSCFQFRLASLTNNTNLSVCLLRVFDLEQASLVYQPKDWRTFAVAWKQTTRNLFTKITNKKGQHIYTTIHPHESTAIFNRFIPILPLESRTGMVISCFFFYCFIGNKRVKRKRDIISQGYLGTVTARCVCALQCRNSVWIWITHKHKSRQTKMFGRVARDSWWGLLPHAWTMEREKRQRSNRVGCVLKKMKRKKQTHKHIDERCNLIWLIIRLNRTLPPRNR